MALNSQKLHAIRLFLKGIYTLEEIAEQVGVSRSTIGEWKKDPEFVTELKRKYALLDQIDAQWRLDRNKELLEPVLKALASKMEGQELEGLKIPELMKLIVTINREIREDTVLTKQGKDDSPQDNVDTEKEEMDALEKRFNESQGVVLFGDDKDDDEIEKAIDKTIKLFEPSEAQMKGIEETQKREEVPEGVSKLAEQLAKIMSPPKVPKQPKPKADESEVH